MSTPLLTRLRKEAKRTEENRSEDVTVKSEEVELPYKSGVFVKKVSVSGTLYGVQWVLDSQAEACMRCDLAFTIMQVCVSLSLLSLYLSFSLCLSLSVSFFLSVCLSLSLSVSI